MAVNLVTVATINRTNLYRGQPGTSAATLYTVPASTDVKVVSIVLSNTTSAIANVTLSVVASGGSAGVTNQIASALNVAANTTITIDTPVFMNAGDFIAGLQGTSGAITAVISGETYA